MILPHNQILPLHRGLLLRETMALITYYSLTSDTPKPSRSFERTDGRQIFNLNPKLLTSADFLDISHKKNVFVHFASSGVPSGSGTVLCYDAVHPIPSHARGFFYYHSETHATPLQCCVRFRITPDNTALSFPRGEDLRTPSGLLWQIPLPRIAVQKGYSKLRQQLLHENLTTEEDLSLARDVFRGQRPPPHNIVFNLDSTFLIKFSEYLILHVIGDAV
ncbi:hypothetical protein C8R44DRAFT_894183 [Mycena epipterygia]|nr:hypothetical protein C8R44DRAFT_894183 [Mycena epipterygia]